MRKGAYDYLLKPFSLETMEQRIRMALNETLPHEEISPEEDFSHGPMAIMTQDRKMKEMIELCQRIASSKATVLIQGESGTGKELFARYIHVQSPRRRSPSLLSIVPPYRRHFLKSELFGYEKGPLLERSVERLGNLSWLTRGHYSWMRSVKWGPFSRLKSLGYYKRMNWIESGGESPFLSIFGSSQPQTENWRPVSKRGNSGKISIIG